MQPLLALCAALTWGTGNFSMGVAGRKGSARVPVLVGFGAGLCGSLIFFAIQQPTLDGSSFMWGALAGVSQGLGWLAFSRALFLGPISLVAPLSAATTVVSLYVIGIISGSSASNPVSIGGGVLALCAIILLSKPREIDEELGAGGPHTEEGGGIIYALISGAMFCLQSLALKQAGDTSTSLVITGAGIGVILLIGLTAITHPFAKADFRRAGPIAAFGGIVIFLGDLSYIYALNNGPLTNASVLGQLHPLFTVILALFFLREKMPKSVFIGIVFALIGASLIAAG